MKLGDLKMSLIEQFFKDSSNGINHDQLDEVFEDLGQLISEDLSRLAEKDVDIESGISSDPSKAFRRFTDGKRCILSICEENGYKQMAKFAAARVGRHVVYMDLTTEDREPKKGDMAVVKQALRQAKNLNDDVYYSISSED